MVTTVMLRNIPNRYTQSQLIEEIHGVGFAGRFDFFYLPMDVHNRTNVGYAFINFLTPADAHGFFSRFRNYMFKRHTSKKIAGVSPAHVQGLVNNLHNFSNRAVAQSRDSEYRPVVLVNGIRMDITEALEELQQPESLRYGSSPCNARAWPGQAASAAASYALPWECAGPGDVASAPWPTAYHEPPPGLGDVASAGTREQRLQLEALLPFLAPVDQAAVPQLPVPSSTDGRQQQAFTEARKAFENAVSSLLQDSQAGNSFSTCGTTANNDSALDSRTGTPRSTNSSLAGCKGELLDHETLTPRTDKRLLGMTLTTFSL